MAHILKSPQAEIDLDEIWWHVAQESPQNADNLIEDIHEKCSALAEFPNIGISREELKPLLRSFPVGRYLIFYFALENGIDIVRILHGARDIKQLF